MSSVLIVLVVGILLGATIFPVKFLGINNKISQAGVVITLFAMGASLGSSPTFLADLEEAGLTALVFSAATVLFSVLAVWLIAKKFFYGGRKK